MPNFNKVILAGNLTRDPELRYTPKGTAVVKLGLAINRSWTDSQSNEKREEVTFVDVDAFGRTAETIAQYLKKGRPILIEGRLKLDTWDDKQTNQKRSKLGVICETFQFLDSGGQRGDSDSQPDAQDDRSRPQARSYPDRMKDARAAEAPPQGDPSQPEEEDDVPF